MQNAELKKSVEMYAKMLERTDVTLATHNGDMTDIRSKNRTSLDELEIVSCTCDC